MLRSRARLITFHSESGFTLMETLVSMVTAIVITLAAFALLQLVGEQTSRATDYLQASQTGRRAMAHVVEELNSVCLSSAATPLREESTNEKLYFVTGYSKKVEIAPSEVQKHEVYWEATKGEIGKLYDATALGEKETSSGSYEWQFGKYTPVLLDANTKRTPTGKGTNEPLFKYYKYGEHAEESSEGGISALTEVPLKSGEPLEAKAKEVAAVQITFRSLPTDNSEKPGRDLDLTSRVTFAFSATFAEPTITESGPCK